MTWIASLPMYNVTPALAALWRELLDDALRAVTPDVAIIDAGDDLHALWRRDDLLLAQTCGYPLMHGLQDRVQLVATPEFNAPGCDGTDYSSALVTRASAPLATLEACRGARAAFNQDDSNSGMNVLRHAVAPLARDGRFFSEVVRTGSHLGSLRALAEDRADIAAIDCVTMAYVRDALPELAQQVRQIGWSAASPGLPLIAVNTVAPETVAALRHALNAANDAQPQRAAQLRLKRFTALTFADYARIGQLEDEAIAAGYPRLA
ncbi:phosphate ABC transporter substrate-binding protein [Paraburkholderia acidicola]|uniref:Phosphate ABC transporter substrate-binding protein n=1 Tax=Paraburkholderia acidicola TaxID=1912599 RepID=A0A2A4EQY7_9BURK|nr:PhnD/SsuA/transferrin family substrate-binding protein [Paraburkholderia acidicola]PCE22704.1 phosphate ABC transporter substrate-binding protein [Paraburkholderia acidicola]